MYLTVRTNDGWSGIVPRRPNGNITHIARLALLVRLRGAASLGS